jgi:hypothetical protein
MNTKFIKQNKSFLYCAKMLNGTWFHYLNEIDNVAKEMVDKIIKDLIAEEIAFSEIIYK